MAENRIILLNFGHPLTQAHIARLHAMTGHELDVRIYIVHFNPERPFDEQVTELIDAIGLSSTEWQTCRLLINPPAHNLFALALLAELHGRMGYFPAIVRLKPVNGALPMQLNVAEIVSLQAIRDKARAQR